MRALGHYLLVMVSSLGCAAGHGGNRPRFTSLVRGQATSYAVFYGALLVGIGAWGCNQPAAPTGIGSESVASDATAASTASVASEPNTHTTSPVDTVAPQPADSGSAPVGTNDVTSLSGPGHGSVSSQPTVSSPNDHESDATPVSSEGDRSTDGAAASDATAAPPPNAGDSCAGRDYLVCESFEDTELGAIPDGWERRGDEVYVSDESAHRGGKSLKLDRKVSWERRIARDATVLGAAHWGRIYYRVELPVPDAFVHSTMVSLTGDGPLNGASEYRFVDTVKQAVDTPDVGSRHNWIFNVQPENVGEWGRETSYDWQFDGEWHCVEYFVDSVNQAFRFFFDGAEELAFEDGPGHYDRTDLPERFDELRVGWTNYQDAPPGFVAHIDDIAFDDERVGCD